MTATSVQIVSGADQPTSTTKVTPWLGSNGGPCGVTLATVTSAAPTKRWSLPSGNCWELELYSLADTMTAESAEIASQLRLTTFRPGFICQNTRATTGTSGSYWLS